MAITVKSHTKTGYEYQNVIRVEPKIVLVGTIDPKCIVQHKTISDGDYVTYRFYECEKLGGGSGTFELDSSGIPTVTGGYGVYECTIQFNGGADEVENIGHVDASAIEALFNIPSQDAEGATDISPASDTPLVYVSNTGNDATAGPSGNGTDNYVLGDLPNPGNWESPGAVNAYSTLSGAFAEHTDQTDMWILLNRGDEWDVTARISGKEGESLTKPFVWRAYGAGARPHINYSGTDGNPAIWWVNDDFVRVLGLKFHPTFRDPTHGDFTGWGNTTNAGGGIELFGNCTNILIEDCEFLYTDGSINMTGGTPSDIIIRRNVFSYTYSEDSFANSIFGSEASVLIEDNGFYHCGWIRQSVDVSGTASSGSTTTLTDTGAFTGEDYTNIQLSDDTNGGTTTITSNTNDTLTFGSAANVDFTGGGDYTIGGGKGQGQAVAENHSAYLANCSDFIIRNNISVSPSASHQKLTSNSTDSSSELAGEWKMSDGLIYNNCWVDGETGLSAGGNTDFNQNSRFSDLRFIDNVILQMCETDPTGRGVAWGAWLYDWRRGCAGNNIMAQFDTLGTNFFGIDCQDHNQDMIVTTNTIVDIGQATGSGTTTARAGITWDPTGANFSDCIDTKNIIQMINTDAQVRGDHPDGASITYSDNQYYTSRTSTEWGQIDNVDTTYANWVASTGETGSSNTQVTFVAGTVDITDYQTSLAETATTAAFGEAVVAQRTGTWDTDHEAIYVNAYFKARYRE